jgi:hypothetical protein
MIMKQNLIFTCLQLYGYKMSEQRAKSGYWCRSFLLSTNSCQCSSLSSEHDAQAKSTPQTLPQVLFLSDTTTYSNNTGFWPEDNRWKDPMPQLYCEQMSDNHGQQSGLWPEKSLYVNDMYFPFPTWIFFLFSFVKQHHLPCNKNMIQRN